MHQLITSIISFASTYGSHNYDTTTYNGAAGSTSTSTTTLLTNTGFDIALAITLACFIIFVALIVRFAHRRSRTLAPTVSAATTTIAGPQEVSS